MAKDPDNARPLPVDRNPPAPGKVAEEAAAADLAVASRLPVAGGDPADVGAPDNRDPDGTGRPVDAAEEDPRQVAARMGFINVIAGMKGHDIHALHMRLCEIVPLLQRASAEARVQVLATPHSRLVSESLIEFEAFLRGRP